MLNVESLLSSLISPSTLIPIPIESKSPKSDFEDILNNFIQPHTNQDIKNKTKDIKDYISIIFNDIITLFGAFNKSLENQNIKINLSDMTDNIKSDTIKLLDDIKSLESFISPNSNTSLIDDIINDIKNQKPNQEIEISISLEEKSTTSFESIISSLDKYIFSNKNISYFISSFSFEVFYYDKSKEKQNILSLKAFNKDNIKEIPKNSIVYKNMVYEISFSNKNIDPNPKISTTNEYKTSTNIHEDNSPDKKTIEQYNKPLNDISTKNSDNQEHIKQTDNTNLDNTQQGHSANTQQIPKSLKDEMIENTPITNDTQKDYEAYKKSNVEPNNLEEKKAKEDNNISDIYKHITKEINTSNLEEAFKNASKLDSTIQDLSPVKDAIKELSKGKDTSNENLDMSNQNQQNILNTRQNQTQNTPENIFESIQKTILKEAYTPPLVKNISIMLDDNTSLRIKFNANNISIAINTSIEIINKEYQTKELIQNLQNLGFAVENFTINGMPVETQTGFSDKQDSNDNESKKDDKEKEEIDFLDAV